ncbi:MAG: hypothetical protein WHT81_02170 [Rectinemataceae bacterium]
MSPDNPFHEALDPANIDRSITMESEPLAYRDIPGRVIFYKESLLPIPFYEKSFYIAVRDCNKCSPFEKSYYLEEWFYLPWAALTSMDRNLNPVCIRRTTLHRPFRNRDAEEFLIELKALHHPSIEFIEKKLEIPTMGMPFRDARYRNDWDSLVRFLQEHPKSHTVMRHNLPSGRKLHMNMVLSYEAEGHSVYAGISEELFDSIFWEYVDPIAQGAPWRRGMLRGLLDGMKKGGACQSKLRPLVKTKNRN